MNLTLAFFPILLPVAAKWAEGQEKLILNEGVPLSAQGLSDARKVGVGHPEKIRLLKVDSVPMPAHPLLVKAAAAAGLGTQGTSGMALGYGIFIRVDCWGQRRLIAHECVHTAQYERLGGIRPFLNQYLRECLEVGYSASPLEMEAVETAANLK